MIGVLLVLFEFPVRGCFPLRFFFLLLVGVFLGLAHACIQIQRDLSSIPHSTTHRYSTSSKTPPIPLYYQELTLDSTTLAAAPQGRSPFSILLVQTPSPDESAQTQLQFRFLLDLGR